MENILEKLVKEHGNETVITAAKQLLDKEQYKRTGAYHDLLAPGKIIEDLQFVNHALQDIHDTGNAVQEAYKNRSDLVRRITELDTTIELDEAEAFMMVDGNKVEIEGKVVTLSNDKMRDAYRKHASREAREKRAAFEAELKQIEIEIAKAKDKQDDAKQSADLMKARLYVTANLLKFLS